MICIHDLYDAFHIHGESEILCTSIGEDFFLEVRRTFDSLEFGLENIESCDSRRWQTYVVGQRVCEDVMYRNCDNPIFRQGTQCCERHV